MQFGLNLFYCLVDQGLQLTQIDGLQDGISEKARKNNVREV